MYDKLDYIMRYVYVCLYTCDVIKLNECTQWYDILMIYIVCEYITL